MDRYDDAKFGIFIHWYAFEWSTVSSNGSAERVSSTSLLSQ